MASDGIGAPADPTELRGRTAPWGTLGIALIAACVLVGLWLRVHGLAAEGFADDEVHKWLAANRYLHGDFGGDDVEHPMLMKSLAALVIATLRGALPMEALTRLPNAVAGALTAWAVALLGRRLFGNAAGLLAAALVALSTTAIGYGRIAKEDTLLGLFMVLFLWCFAEARAAAEDGRGAEQRRWELWSAAALGAAFASKYFLFYFPIPLLAYAWLRPVSAWRVPLRRWLALIGVAFLVFVVLDFTSVMPSTWSYLAHYMRGDQVGGDRGVSESMVFMGRLYGNLAPLNGSHTPWWFFLAFAAVKFAPVTAVLGAFGLGLAVTRRAPAHRIVLAWAGFWFLFFVVAGTKYGRFFTSIMPAFLLLAAHATVSIAGWFNRIAAGTATGPILSPRATIALCALVPVLAEASATVAHMPHHRLYINAFGGGDRSVTWFFPHCDYWDIGVREAVGWIAEHAEPHAEVVSEVDWTIRLYAELAARPDLVSSPFLPGRGCHTGAPCYVIVQPGRRYWHNEAALPGLTARTPVFVEKASGTAAATVYRLAPGDPLFPPK
jgi:4-amino-4-deoxy-L-arabinose transferase-like glycosyltransferase